MANSKLQMPANYMALNESEMASGSFDVETGEMGRNIYIYTPV